MKNRFVSRACIIFLLLTLALGVQGMSAPDQAHAASPSCDDGTNVIVNCSFEYSGGSFVGWTTQDIDHDIYTNDQLRVDTFGAMPSYNIFFAGSPTDGNFAAFSGFDGYNSIGLIRIAQDVNNVPPNAHLTFEYRAGWSLNVSNLDRYFEVTIEPLGGGSTLRQDLILVAPAAQYMPDTGLLTGDLDLGSFAGQAIRINFDLEIDEANDDTGFFQLDNIWLGNTVPEMNVTGNSISIADGDTTPSLADYTDFGNIGIGSSPVEHTFTIQNSGPGVLNLTGSPIVTVSGANAGDFSVTVQPVSPVTSGNSATFTVHFYPLAIGTRTAILSIANDDGDENPYNFSIQGTGVCSASITVTNAGDNGAGSLRQAIADVCTGGTITFNGDHTVVLASELVISKSLTIDGTGNNVTVSGNHATRVFNITGGTITLNRLTIADGYFVDNSYSGDSGGGIRFSGSTLYLTNSTVSNNTTGWPGGGGLELWSGTANVINSTFIGNSGVYGGGIDVFRNGTLNVANSTFFNNSAGSAGGGLSIGGVGNIINSTISGNSAGWAGGGGGINNEAGSVTVTNSIIANNPTGGNCYNHYSGYSFVGVNSLVDDGSCSAGFVNSSSTLLGPLGNYGGSTQTFPLLPGSAAIDAGVDATCTDATTVNGLDQRGVSRATNGAHCDIGAFESQGFTLTKTGGDHQSTLPNTPFATPLGLTVTANSAAEPVNGGNVTFTAPSSGASTNPTTSTATIASGSVSKIVTANGTSGSYNVTAGANGAVSMDFALTNTVPSALSATKTVSGSFQPGSTLTYTIMLTNLGTGYQQDNPGNELTDVLPAQLTLVSALPTSGATAANLSTNTVTWNGSIPPYGGSVTITIIATIKTGTGGQTVSNQGTVSYDADANGSNESTVSTDDPGVAGTSDSTTFQVNCLNSVTVNNIADSGAGSLRDAIGDVCAGGTIDFNPTLSGQTITLTSGQLSISKSLTINGLTTSPGVFISGNDAVRVFYINGGTVNINNLTIQNGRNVPTMPANLGGAGLFITNTGTTVTLNNCAVLNNATSPAPAYAVGGGIVVDTGASLTMNNCTVSGNSSSFDGGGILNQGMLNINNGTIVNNTTPGSGGGLETITTTTTLRNTILAGNSGASGADCYTPIGVIQSAGYNMVGSTVNCVVVPSTGDVTGFSYAALLLGALQNNGGPNLTYALLPGSPAIDAIPGCNGAPASDQRGVSRPQSVACDVGAYEKVAISATSTGVSSSINPSTFGQTVTFTATVSPTPDGGTLAFKDNGTVITGCGAKSLTSGQATCATSTLTTGSHIITAEYSGTTNYAASNGTLTPDQQVNKAMSVITWANPADINYGTPLSATQLNASANVPGAFTYTPAAGVYLAVGVHTLHVDFVPTDTANYANASRDVSINILDHVIFGDIPDSYWAKSFIESLFFSQITGGCGGAPLNYCPEMGVTRAQLAVFLLRAKYGAPYLPPAVGASTGFNDVSTSYWAAAWIKQLTAEGITTGCGGGNFCPERVVTRAELAVLLLRTEYGNTYTPPVATGLFNDVPANFWAAPWIEQLVSEGITGGCGNNNFCPDQPVTRAQIAVFLVKAFNLP